MKETYSLSRVPFLLTPLVSGPGGSSRELEGALRPEPAALQPVGSASCAAGGRAAEEQDPFFSRAVVTDLSELIIFLPKGFRCSSRAAVL